MNLSMLLQDLPANSPVFVHQIDLLQKETSGSFYLDEVIIVDRTVTGKGTWFSFLLLTVQDTPLKSLMIGLVETFSKGKGLSQQAQMSIFLIYLKCVSTDITLGWSCPDKKTPKQICFQL